MSTFGTLSRRPDARPGDAAAGPAPSASVLPTTSNSALARMLARSPAPAGAQASTADPAAAGGTAPSVVDEPLDYAVGLLGQRIDGRLKKGERKEWTVSRTMPGNHWPLPHIRFPLGPVLRGFVEGEAQTRAGVGARGSVEAQRAEAGPGTVTDTLTIKGNANVTGGLSGGLRAGIEAGIPQVLEARANAAGRLALEGRGTMDINATATRTGPGNGAGGWTFGGGYEARIDGALMASLRGEVSLHVLWWDKTLASFNIANWQLGRGHVHIKGNLTPDGGMSLPKIDFRFDPPEAPKPVKTAGTDVPPPKPREGAQLSRSPVPGAAPPEDPSAPAAALAMAMAAAEPSAAGSPGAQPAPVGPDGQLPEPAPAPGPAEDAGPQRAVVGIGGEEPVVELP